MLVRYEDLAQDLVGEMRRLAKLLDFQIDEHLLARLAGAATFDAMKAQTPLLVPDRGGLMKDQSRFFRRGSSGAAREILTGADLAAYEARVESLAPPDFLEWLHR